eukprot:7668321-Pyramimonas_sp.AAC.1
MSPSPPPSGSGCPSGSSAGTPRSSRSWSAPPGYAWWLRAQCLAPMSSASITGCLSKGLDFWKTEYSALMFGCC